MKAKWLAGWRGSFFTGLAVVLPAALSIGVVIWLFGTVANVTDTLLFFLPKSITHGEHGAGPVVWYWSLVALLVAVLLITAVGRLTRNYLGRRLIEVVDAAILHIPLLNKIYSTIKQVNVAFTTGNKSSFNRVVLVEFPRAGHYSIGFVTGAPPPAAQAGTREKIVSVFVPTTPNPTSGFLVFAPEDSLVNLDMSVADGIKYIISLGSVAPEATPSTSHFTPASPVTR